MRGGKRRERLAAVRTHGLQFDVNCSILFTELPLLKRPGAARAAGFDAVEFWWPFAGPVPGDPADSSTSFGWRGPDEV